MASVVSGHSSTSRPDKPLVVECSFDRSMRRIKFTSSKNCSYVILRRKVEQCFSIQSRAVVVSYKDDDGQITDITSDEDLTEAITYFAYGTDDGPISSNASWYSGRSSNSRKIVLRVDIAVDYDGPGLSDTGSLVSLEEYKYRNGSDGSLGMNNRDLRNYGKEDRELDDDEVTVSSRPAPSINREMLPRRSTTQSSRLSTQSHPFHQPSVGGSMGGLGRLPEEPGDLDVHEHRLRDSQVFERLRAAESAQNLQERNGPAEWLAKLNAHNPAILGTGAQLGPSISDLVDGCDRLSLSDIPPGEADDLPGDLVLQQDPKRLRLYTLRSNSRSSSILSHSSDGHRRNPNRVSIETNRGGSSAAPYSHRGSYASFDSTGLMMGVLVGPSHSRDLRAPSPSNNNRSFETIHPIIHIDDAASHPDIPSEVLPFLPSRGPAEAVQDPSELTECSHCSTALNSFRYVCATCGPRKPRAQNNVAMPSGNVNGKGKGRADTSLSASDRPSGSGTSIESTTSSASSGWAILDNTETHELTPIHTYPPSVHSQVNGNHSSHSRVSGQGHSSVRPLPPLPLSLSTAILPGGQGLTPPLLPSRRGSTVSSGSGSRLSTSTTPTLFTDTGFELCLPCMEAGVGVDHAAESVLGAPITPLTGGTIGSSPSGYGGSQVSLDTGSWRRATPKKKTLFRHAFVEQFWGPSGWTEVEQADVEKCTTCGSLLKETKYKCSTCESMILCKGCYSQVHEVHPVHAFLVSQKKEEEKAPPIEAVGRSATPPLVVQPQDEDVDEISMVHPDVKCTHCMQDIVGARFHCAICPSVDICSQCEAAGLPGNLTTTEDNGHESSHIMIKIPFPLQHDEVRTASRRAMHLWAGRAGDAPGIGQAAMMNDDLMGLEKKAMLSDYGGTVLGEKNGRNSMNGSTKGADPRDHRIQCNGCGRNIVGIRYQCAGCPALPGSIYSLCAECDTRSYMIHDPTHSFFKIPTPVDHPIYSKEALVPPLYIMHAGQSLDGTVNNDEDPRAYLQTIQNRSAVCDRCVQRITGEWFRCVYCPKDLCEECEALDSHDPSHLFIVFKSVVDTALLRSLTDAADESSPGRPLIPYAVYTNHA